MGKNMTKAAERPPQREYKPVKNLNLSPSSPIRIINEYKSFNDNFRRSKTIKKFSYSCETLLKWNILLLPQKEPYNTNAWQVQFQIPPDYPRSPPNIKFLTPIYHPNVSPESGEVKLEKLKPDQWKDTFTMVDVVKELIETIDSPKYDKKKKDLVLNKDAEKKLKSKCRGFNKAAKKHASEQALKRPYERVPPNKTVADKAVGTDDARSSKEAKEAAKREKKEKEKSKKKQETPKKEKKEKGTPKKTEETKSARESRRESRLEERKAKQEAKKMMKEEKSEADSKKKSKSDKEKEKSEKESKKAVKTEKEKTDSKNKKKDEKDKGKSKKETKEVKNDKGKAKAESNKK